MKNSFLDKNQVSAYTAIENTLAHANSVNLIFMWTAFGKQSKLLVVNDHIIWSKHLKQTMFGIKPVGVPWYSQKKVKWPLKYAISNNVRHKHTHI